MSLIDIVEDARLMKERREKKKKKTKFKRTNWTTEEVIELVEQCRLYDMDGKEDVACGTHSDAITTVRHMFENFLRPSTQSGAMAYDPESSTIYHIGPRLPR